MKRLAGPLLAAAIVAALTCVAALWATPYALMHVAMKRLSADAGLNRMRHQGLPDHTSRAVVRPSPDLAYSVCVFDVREGPVRIDAAIPPAHYWSLSVFAPSTDNIFSVNDREAGKKVYSIVLSSDGRDGSLKVPGGKGIALIRILASDKADLQSIDTLRRRSRCGRVYSDFG